MAGGKTVRFARVVERSGRPHVHTLWAQPDKDPEFRRARESNRVMTVHPSATGKADAGSVGFDPKHSSNGQYLVFPKSLKPFEGARVIGLKFDLVEQPKSVAAPAVVAPAEPATSKRVSKRNAHPAPRPEPPRSPATAREEENTPSPELPRPAAPEEKRTPTRGGPPPGKKARAANRETRGTTESVRSTRAKPPIDGPVGESLLREVRLALDELEDGKAVAAYRRLERAVRAAEGR